MIGNKYRPALEQAKYIYGRRSALSATEQADAIAALLQIDLWSDRQVAAIVGVPARAVHAQSTKSTREGGRFDPAGIDAVLHLLDLQQRSEVDIFATRRALEQCCGPYMLAKLTGLAPSTIKRHNERAKKALGLQ